MAVFIKHTYVIVLFSSILFTGIFFLQYRLAKSSTQNLGVEETSTYKSEESDYLNWKRPDSPLKVGIQAGHFKNSEVPDELENIRKNGGTTNGKVDEWEVNLKIAEEIKKILEPKGIIVEILPATIPPDFWADAFVSIHADGNPNRNVSGFKMSTPRRDLTKKAIKLEKILMEEYAMATNLPVDPNITNNMRGYYAFAWRRFDHTIHPMTPAVIIETGFLTNQKDAKIIANTPDIPAKAIANGLMKFLSLSLDS